MCDKLKLLSSVKGKLELWRSSATDELAARPVAARDSSEGSDAAKLGAALLTSADVLTTWSELAWISARDELRTWSTMESLECLLSSATDAPETPPDSASLISCLLKLSSSVVPARSAMDDGGIGLCESAFSSQADQGLCQSKCWNICKFSGWEKRLSKEGLPMDMDKDGNGCRDIKLPAPMRSCIEPPPSARKPRGTMHSSQRPCPQGIITNGRFDSKQTGQLASMKTRHVLSLEWGCLHSGQFGILPSRVHGALAKTARGREEGHA
mmetsp:Transcript_1292/g.2721  ORF Transcript_1292/g.2721 Transcript_1292/m.2721 type:complete len:268 (+) Transcript_1292:1126-1929(+)